MAKHILLGRVRKLVSCTFVDTAANRKIYNDCDSVILPKQSNQNIISQITSLCSLDVISKMKSLYKC